MPSLPPLRSSKPRQQQQKQSTTPNDGRATGTLKFNDDIFVQAFDFFDYTLKFYPVTYGCAEHELEEERRSIQRMKNMERSFLDPSPNAVEFSALYEHGTRLKRVLRDYEKYNRKGMTQWKTLLEYSLVPLYEWPNQMPFPDTLHELRLLIWELVIRIVSYTFKFLQNAKWHPHSTFLNLAVQAWGNLTFDEAWTLAPPSRDSTGMKCLGLVRLSMFEKVVLEYLAHVTLTEDWEARSMRKLITYGVRQIFPDCSSTAGTPRVDDVGGFDWLKRSIPLDINLYQEYEELDHVFCIALPLIARLAELREKPNQSNGNSKKAKGKGSSRSDFIPPNLVKIGMKVVKMK